MPAAVRTRLRIAVGSEARGRLRQAGKRSRTSSKRAVPSSKSCASYRKRPACLPGERGSYRPMADTDAMVEDGSAMSVVYSYDHFFNLRESSRWDKKSKNPEDSLISHRAHHVRYSHALWFSRKRENRPSGTHFP